jgi:chemotaxis protein CheD
LRNKAGQQKEIARFQYFLKPGYIFLTREPTLVYSVMGSAVTVCLWDRHKRFGGVSHFLYPQVTKAKPATAQFGNVAILTLIKLMVKDGAEKSGLEAQIFGGGDPHSSSEETLGWQNVNVAKTILNKQEIAITSEDVGGSKGRKLAFKTDSNEAVVLKVERLRQEDWYPYLLPDTR